jgi:hypothetical protein
MSINAKRSGLLLPATVVALLLLLPAGTAVANECIGDLTRDGQVGSSDLTAILFAWGPCPGCPEDLNGDGVVDQGDFAVVICAWGPCPGGASPPPPLPPPPPPVPPPPGCPLSVPGILTQSVVGPGDVAQYGSTVSCGIPDQNGDGCSEQTPQGYARVFNKAQEGVVGPVTIQSITFGVYRNSYPNIPINVNLYLDLNGSAAGPNVPGSDAVLAGQTAVSLAANVSGPPCTQSPYGPIVVNFNPGVVWPDGCDLWVEIENPQDGTDPALNDLGDYFAFRPASNAGGQCGPTWFRPPVDSCGSVGAWINIGTIGFPTTHLIMEVGYSFGGAGDCPTGPGGACTPDAGDCCASNGSPGCEHATTCACVCAIDPFCCDVTWDAQCAAQAQDVCGLICVVVAPPRLAEGPRGAGNLEVSPDDFGSVSSNGFVPPGHQQGGDWNDIYNGQEVSFTNGFVYYNPSRGERQMLSANPSWLDVGPDDDSIDIVVAAAAVGSDTNFDTLNDRSESSFLLSGFLPPPNDTDLSIEVVNQVDTGLVHDNRAAWTQTLTITNNSASAIAFNLLRQLDADLLFDPQADIANDEVGTSTNALGGEVFVFVQEVGDADTAVALSSPVADAYYGAKNGCDPDGNGVGPPMGFGTDVQEWEAYGVPAGWADHVAGLGTAIDGTSGPMPTCSIDPADAHLGLNLPIVLPGGRATIVTITFTHGSNCPVEACDAPPPPPGCPPSANDCFQPAVTPGCNDPECCLAVCVQQPSCCAVAWDNPCVALAALTCVEAGFHFAEAVDNSAADGVDGFGSGVTHFTIDLMMQASPGATWSSTQATFALTAPGVQFFQHAPPGGLSAPNAAFFGLFPALEFDSFYTEPAAIDPGGSGAGPDIFFPGASEASPAVTTAGWASNNQLPVPQAGTIARYTLIVPPGVLPFLVPAGSTGGLPLLGTLTGATTTDLSCGIPVPLAMDLVNGAPVGYQLAQVEPTVGPALEEAIGDLTGSGGPDVVALVPGELAAPLAGGVVQVFLNQGTDPSGAWMGLSPGAIIKVGPDVRDATLGLFDGDAHLDLAVAEGIGGSVAIVLNDGSGNGTFLPPVTIPLGGEIVSIASADFSEDGLADVAAADASGASIRILVNSGPGGFGLGPIVPAGIDPVAIEPEDIDNDKCEDMIVAGNGLGPGGFVAVIRNLGRGNFAKPILLPVGADPLDVATADFDQDGLPDIASANNGDGTVSVIRNAGRGSFAPALSIPVGLAPRSIDAPRADCDLAHDIVVVADHPTLGGVVYVFVNQSRNPGELAFDAPLVFTAGPGPNVVVSGPLDGDGLIDLVTANADEGSGSVSALLNTSECLCADFNGDGLINVIDMVAVILAWGMPDPDADYNGDGVVDVQDLVQVVIEWGECM